MLIATSSDINLLKSLGSITPAIALKKADVKNVLASRGDNLIISDDTLDQICSAVNSRNHVILIGPPGTGKTTLANAVAIAAQKRAPIITTATADWTTFDTIGGYMPDVKNPQSLVFEFGIILQSIIDRVWIIVDEINRAQIDKAIGPLFSVLSDGDVSLTYRSEHTGNRIKIVSDNKANTLDTFYKTSDWRMIATMNEFDKLSLFDLSYAFMRRFAMIRIGVPENYSALIEAWSNGLDTDVKNNLKKLALFSEQGKIREIGPALFKNIIEYLRERGKINSEFLKHYNEGIELYLLPQFQGLDEIDVINFWNVVKEVFSGDQVQEEKLKRSISTITGYYL